MKKVLVFSIIFFVVMLFANSLVLASDINMNLATGSTYPTSTPPASTSSIPSPSLPGSTAALSESSLTLSNILNIILIVLGILLVLFAIAISLRIR